MGANIFRDLFANIRDIVGGRSAAYEQELARARTIALDELKTAAQQVAQTLARGVTLSRLRPMLAAVDQQHAIARHPAAGQQCKLVFDVRGQRGSGDIDAQFNGGRYLVYVLAARTGGTHKALLDLCLVDNDLVGDADRRATARGWDGPTSGGRRPRTSHRFSRQQCEGPCSQRLSRMRTSTLSPCARFASFGLD